MPTTMTHLVLLIQNMFEKKKRKVKHLGGQISKRHFIRHKFPCTIVFKAQFRILDEIIEEKFGCYKTRGGSFYAPVTTQTDN